VYKYLMLVRKGCIVLWWWVIDILININIMMMMMMILGFAYCVHKDLFSKGNS